MIENIKWGFFFLPIFSACCGGLFTIILLIMGEKELVEILRFNSKKNKSNREKADEAEAALAFGFFGVLAMVLFILMGVLSGLPLGGNTP